MDNALLRMPRADPANALMRQPVGLSPIGGGLGLAPAGVRHDGSGAKGRGFFGPLKTTDNRAMTELSIGVRVGGVDMEIPALVPTLSPQELRHLADGGDVTQEIEEKAYQYAVERLRRGLSPFAGPGELQVSP